MDTDTPEHLRLFVAIQIPEQIKAAMATAQGELRRVLPGRGVTWTKPEQFHLTLRFLGKVEVKRVDELRNQLGAACEGYSPLRLVAERLGAFPDLRFPRVIWVGLGDKAGRLGQLQAAVEAASRDFTNEPRGEKFSGHVTLGRAKHLSRREAHVLSETLTRMAQRSFGAWAATEIELMRSELSPAGARHTCIGTVLLNEGGTAGLNE